MVDVSINGKPVSGGGAGSDPPARTEHYLNESDHYRNLASNLEFDSQGQEGAENDLTVVIQEDASKPVEQVGIERADGALIIRLDGKPYTREAEGSAKEHDANLAEHIDDQELARICDELLNGIDADERMRQEWLDRRASGIKHLAL